MPYLLLSLAACFWGGNYVVGHVLVAQVDPIVLSEARWMLTALLLISLYFRQIKAQWAAMTEAKYTVFFLALCGQVLFPVTLYVGLQYTSSLNAAIYLSTTPALVLLINKFIFKEAISRRNIYGVVLSSLGVIYLVMQGDLLHLNTLKNLNRGDVWTMASAISWALYCAFLRLKPKQIGGNAFVAVSAAIGAIVLLPVLSFYSATHFGPPLKLSLDPGFMLGLAYLVIFPSWLSYLLWNKGIQAIGATRGEVYSHLIPLTGGVFSVLFLNVPLHGFHLISALLIALGIALCSMAPKQKPLAPDPCSR
ncbi:aromatic amino acid exporter [Buttiauxella agrestis]|uniref:Threonine/homoserine exporter RhtA n=1 Tax=Buttiauxella agrestis TaxID=82977 RepID=A0A381C983_9ENTR|nr:DMT family transporter [Buttiauxella agrestis]SUW63909.1 aromatic amino acid exporter [Buttiauxella agrestis]